MASKAPAYMVHGGEIVKAIVELAYRHPTYQIFQDWLEMSAISISNSVDWGNANAREERYLELINQYSKEEQQKFPELFALLVKAMNQESEAGKPCDILGEVFHGLELHNKYKGQFFTPNHVCEFMGEIAIEGAEEAIAKQGYVSVCEPCVGSGSMVIGLAAAMANNKFDYQRQMCVTACDIDIKCVHMAYLQFSLYGIPAVIIHGNSLTMETWSSWYTPMYMADMWAMRERRGIEDVANANQMRETKEIKTEITELELKADESGQFCFI